MESAKADDVALYDNPWWRFSTQGKVTGLLQIMSRQDLHKDVPGSSPVMARLYDRKHHTYPEFQA
tara:strand:+ start:304 stop:498 length:195 start_codon:yes stop_codon:yes gene_type:complete